MTARNNLVEDCIDVNDATIYLTGEVNEDMYKRVVQGLVILSNRNDLTIVLNTLGGDFYQALAIYDLLRFSEHNIKILCAGPVMSAGILILLAAHERVGLPNTQLMIHYGEDSNDSTESIKHNLKLLKMFKQTLAKRVKVGNKKIASWFKHDTFYNAEEAVKVGLLDRVAK